MATETTTLPRRLLARRLVELREAAELKSDEAAKLAEIGRQTLWRLENGRTSEVKKPIIRALCRVYQVSEDDQLGLLWLADESRKDGWWQSLSDAIFNADLFLSLEQAASRIRSFQLTLVPGLVQTADYRRAMAQNYKPVLSAEEIERHIEVLTKRQTRLTDSSDPLTLELWLSEAVLRHRIGGASVMTAQVRHLHELSTLPNVSIRIVPLTVEGYLGLQTGPFVLLEFPRHPNPSLTQPPVVYVESYAGALYLDKPTEVELYLGALSAIEEVALDEPKSRALLQKIEEEYRA